MLVEKNVKNGRHKLATLASREEDSHMGEGGANSGDEQDGPTVGQKRQRALSGRQSTSSGDEDNGGLANAPNQSQLREPGSEPPSPQPSRTGSPRRSQGTRRSQTPADDEEEEEPRHRSRQRLFQSDEEDEENNDEEEGRAINFGYGGDDEDEDDEDEDMFGGKEVVVTKGKKKSKKAKGGDNFDGSKVVEQDFPSQVLPLAKQCKAFFRKQASFGSAFPPRGLLERESYILNLLMDAANDDKDNSAMFVDLLKQISKQYPTLYCQLATFAIYGKRQLLNSLIGKAQQIVEMYFGLPGDLDPPIIRSRVVFLLEKSVFRYGGVDLKDKTYDAHAPCATPLVSNVVRAQWFDGTKGDRPAYWEIIKRKSIPKETLVLCFTVIECILKCWQGGTFTRVHFSEDNCSSRYQFFLETWDHLESNAPDYAKKILSENYDRTLKQTKNASLLFNEGDVAQDCEGINFTTLNEKAAEGALIS
ncbi:hypothetical protein CPB83DRAFT_841298 [Crepidotus variabilis]|uniref:DUF6532 domain-containing protein n=1 Tax=Crepidotus variabilis TaxID=179855 RepID=A0A9P6E2U5_9AGAR|nr:hypothetical protein CPB83DRAFT_841298 [Crepidotus variabilis]